MENKIEKQINGNKITIENDGRKLNIDPNQNYVTMNNPFKKISKGVNKILKKDITTNDSLGPNVVGPGSEGFAGVALLAGIVVIAGIVIAYLTLRY